jgi:hypothetical protein
LITNLVTWSNFWTWKTTDIQCVYCSVALRIFPMFARRAYFYKFDEIRVYIIFCWF